MTRFACSVCKREYHTREEAQACVRKGWKTVAEPGDIVVELCALGLYQDGSPMEGGPHSRYGWYDGDPLWIYRTFPAERDLHRIETYAPYFVVGAVAAGEPAIEAYGHEPCYHLFSEAFRDGKRGFRHGWTTQRYHFAIGKIDNPPAELVAASRKFVGMTSNRLL